MRKVAGHFVPKFMQPLQMLHTQMNEALSQCTVSMFPRPHQPPTQFACPKGHYRASVEFSYINYTKAMWCSKCSKQFSG
eukprot:7058462-Karenia_brevis.AAC.1